MTIYYKKNTKQLIIIYLWILGCLTKFSESKPNEVITESKYIESRFTYVNNERILTTNNQRRRRRRKNFCSGGSYKNNLNIKVNNECPLGRFSPRKRCITITDNNLENICSQCLPGRFANKHASIDCIDCPISKYQPMSGQDSCLKNNNTCNSTDTGLIPGMTNNTCIVCSSIGNIKKNNKCVSCKNRYYFDNTTKTCQKEKLVNEPVFWALSLVSLILVCIWYFCLKHFDSKLACIIVPTMISCIVCAILFGLYIITNSTAGKIILMSNLGCIVLLVLLVNIYAIVLVICKIKN